MFGAVLELNKIQCLANIKKKKKITRKNLIWGSNLIIISIKVNS